jgi:hypothetical protein
MTPKFIVFEPCRVQRNRVTSSVVLLLSWTWTAVAAAGRPSSSTSRRTGSSRWRTESECVCVRARVCVCARCLRRGCCVVCVCVCVCVCTAWGKGALGDYVFRCRKVRKSLASLSILRHMSHGVRARARVCVCVRVCVWGRRGRAAHVCCSYPTSFPCFTFVLLFGASLFLPRPVNTC